jgi:hypothetical protein
VNGSEIEIVEDFSLVLSWSKHEMPFFSNLLADMWASIGVF